jgi:hypothetical protein
MSPLCASFLVRYDDYPDTVTEPKDLLVAYDSLLVIIIIMIIVVIIIMVIMSGLP